MSRQDTIYLQALANLAARAYDEARNKAQKEGVALFIKQINDAVRFPFDEAAAEAYQELLCDKN